MSKVSAAELNSFFIANFPGDRGQIPDITLAEDGRIVMKQKMDERKLTTTGLYQWSNANGDGRPLRLLCYIHAHWHYPNGGDL